MGLFDRLFKRESADAAFWKWFAAAAQSCAFPPPEPFIHEIGDRLRKVDPGLAFQIGKLDGGLVLEISAEGMKAMIPIVQRLCAAAPQIDGWTVKAFRQPTPTARIDIGPRSYSVDDVHFVLERDGGVNNLEIYLAGFGAAPDAIGPIAFLLLDATLGEFAVMTQIGGIDMIDASKRPAHARALRELPAALGMGN